jgi:carbonic anhydrase
MSKSALTPDQALQRLVTGNRRYVSGQALHPNQTAERRLELVSGQAPFAAVLACADSRVPPEVFCDQGLGDLFVVRNAGNVVDDVVLGSLEYAVEHLGAPLLVVVGHTRCGAVTAAVQGGHAPGHIGRVVERLKPAVSDSSAQAGDAVYNAVVAHVRRAVAALNASEPLLSQAVRQGSIKVLGAVYHLDTGELQFI